MSELTQAQVNAAMDAGFAAGQAAGTWFGDPDTDWERVRTMLDDGDPEIYDSVHLPDLSGEMADGLTPRDLCSFLGIDPDDLDTWDLDTLCRAWEDAVTDGFWDEVQRQAAYHTERVR
jgi:hypothetical protein